MAEVIRPQNPVLLNCREGLKTVSLCLIDNPTAVLDEKIELERYFSEHSNGYLQILNQFNEQNEPQNKHILICIPACREQEHIYRTLSSFLNQPKSLINQTTIYVLDNHCVNETPDETFSEVTRFKNDYPELNVNYNYLVVPEGTPFGSIRKILFDLVTWKILQEEQNSQNHILASCDADVYGVSKNYLSSMISSLERQGPRDMAVGSFIYPPEALQRFPLLAAAFSFHRLYRTLKEATTRSIPWSSGRATAFTAEIYGAIGGLDGNIMRASDIDFGERVQAARGVLARDYIHRAHFRIETDPRRVLSKMALEDRCYSDEFEDVDWTRKLEVVGKSWVEYHLPQLETITTEGLEKEFSGILVKKAYRQGYVNQLRDFLKSDEEGMDEWIKQNKKVLSRLFRYMGIKTYYFDIKRNKEINGHKIPRVLVLS